MQRYFAVDKNLTLSNKDIHHIINVMRMKVNDKIQIVYNEEVFLCNIDSILKKSINFSVVEKIDINNELNIKVTIAIPLVTEKKIDYILQKCTELGCHEFIIYESERSKVKVNEKINNKLDRWNLICKEAAEQSFRNYVPKVVGIRNIKSLSEKMFDLMIIGSTKKNKKTLKNLMQNSTNCDNIIIVIGPEGGLSEKEEDFLLNNGYIGASFGGAILRCETAPVFVMSAIKYELGR